MYRGSGVDLWTGSGVAGLAFFEEGEAAGGGETALRRRGLLTAVVTGEAVMLPPPLPSVGLTVSKDTVSECRLTV
jgi:hypothetical protein